MAKNCKFEDASIVKQCFVCNGTGLGSLDQVECKACNGTGQYRDEFYHLIVKAPDGKTIAFGVDSAGK